MNAFDKRLDEIKANWTELPPAEEPFRYLTMSEEIHENGERHARNAARYTIEGKIDHAIGSLRKARRNYLRARQLKELGL